jgi:hypothetical protein
VLKLVIIRFVMHEIVVIELKHPDMTTT